MSRPHIQELPTYSLLDRLTSEEPELSSSMQADHRETLKNAISRRHAPDPFRVHNAIQRYIDSVKRDLEWLLNTRSPFDERLQNYPALSASVFAYGLIDITSLHTSSSVDRQTLLSTMQAVIDNFEPRLKVEVRMESAAGRRPLRFTIAGTVLMQPAPEEVRIETVLDPASGAYEVK